MKTAATTEAMTTAELDTRIVAYTPDLFDDSPVLLGAWPNALALEGRFLARLLRGAEVTAGDWLRDAHSMRLAAEVRQLRELGWCVRSRLIEVRTADRGRRAHVARYWLEHHQCEAASASERGQRFIAAVEAAESGRAAK